VTDLAAQRRVGERVAARVLEARHDLLPRLFAKDPALWVSGERERGDVADRLGWLDLPVAMPSHLAAIDRFVTDVRAAGFRRVVLLGMGGSSLAPDLFARMLGTAPGALALTVLDSTDPAAVLAAEAGGVLAQTLFVVSSKSGGTVEPNAMAAYFLALTGGNGAQFAAITDPGSSLAALGAARGFRHVFLNPPDVGGRYSALSLFGLVPAALLGADVPALLAAAGRSRGECLAGDGAAAQRAARLGATMATGVELGRDRLTFVMPDAYLPFGAWVEQLVAESTGKGGTGVVPVLGETRLAPGAYGADRVFVGMWRPEEGGAEEAALGAIAKAGHPVVAVPFDPALDLGAACFEWEVATALAGVWLKVNPFDQPNVAESKANTDTVLARMARGEATDPGHAGGAGLRGRVSGWLRGVRAGDYVAVLAYLAPTPAHDAFLRRLAAAVGRATHTPVTVGYGPRFLHSTGQLHKGGPTNGAFLQLETEDARDLAVPGAGYTFGTLKLAQALGDLAALTSRGRNVLRVRVAERDLEAVAAALADAAPER
jgi:transaldolase / glucose-6-phosphate isomerase